MYKVWYNLKIQLRNFVNKDVNYVTLIGSIFSVLLFFISFFMLFQRILKCDENKFSLMVLWWQWILGRARKYVSYGFEICSDKTFYFGQSISVTHPVCQFFCVLVHVWKQPFIGVLIKKFSENSDKIIIIIICNFIEITLRHACSPVNMLYIFKTPFPRNTSGRLLLNTLFTIKMSAKWLHPCLDPQ